MCAARSQECSTCHEEINEAYYDCSECDPRFTQCEHCFILDSEKSKRHPHALVRHSHVMPATLLYSFRDDTCSGKHTLYLSNVASALPGSPILQECQIQSVLSLLQPEELEGAFSALTKLYGADTEGQLILRDGLHTVVRDKGSKILYYNLNMADVSNPAILAKAHKDVPALPVSEVFASAVGFIEERLKVGNVLVHCEKGRRRSPTAILAFLIARGFRTQLALQALGHGYLGESDWLVRYRKTRALWIDALSEWEVQRVEKLKQLLEIDRPKLAKAFKGLEWLPADDIALEERKKQLFANSSNKTSQSQPVEDKKRPLKDEKGAPPAKRFKIASSSTVPSIWANKKR